MGGISGSIVGCEWVKPRSICGPRASLCFEKWWGHFFQIKKKHSVTDRDVGCGGDKIGHFKKWWGHVCYGTALEPNADQG